MDLQDLYQYTFQMVNNHWEFIFGIVFAALISYIAYLKGRKEREPLYKISNHNFINNFKSIFDDLDIFYKGEPIKNFSVSKIAFWNSGRETIRRDDIVTTDPIRIHAKNDAIILRENIIQNNKSNSISLIKSPDKTELELDFEYLDKNNGAIIEIFHTGTNRDDLELVGRIKGCNIKLAESSLFEFAIALAPTIIFEYMLFYIKKEYISDLFSAHISIVPMNNTTGAEIPSEIVLHNSNIELIILLMITLLSIGFFYIMNEIVEKHLLLPKGLEYFSESPISKNKNIERSIERSIQRFINFLRR